MKFDRENLTKTKEENQKQLVYGQFFKNQVILVDSYFSLIKIFLWTINLEKFVEKLFDKFNILFEY